MMQNRLNILTSSKRGAGFTRFKSTSVKPELLQILPKKKILNKLLFDEDSRLSYRKVVPVLSEVYSNLDKPENIRLPKYVKGDDLMCMKDILAAYRGMSNAIDKNLVLLENELVEQAAELGNNDSIAILAFERIQDRKTNKEDFKYANELISNLIEIKNPLVFKLAGDLAFKKGLFENAESYWLQFLELEPLTLLASQVYGSLGIYYLQHKYPRPDLRKAKLNLEKCIKTGTLNKIGIQANFYMGQLYTVTDPLLSRYYLEAAAGKGLRESFPALGFMEMNVFNNYSKSLEWFKLGIESNSDITCMIGTFDCYVKMHDYQNASNMLLKLENIKNKVSKPPKSGVSEELHNNIEVAKSLLNIFFQTRKDSLTLLKSI